MDYYGKMVYLGSLREPESLMDSPNSYLHKHVVNCLFQKCQKLADEKMQKIFGGDSSGVRGPETIRKRAMLHCDRSKQGIY